MKQEQTEDAQNILEKLDRLAATALGIKKQRDDLVDAAKEVLMAIGLHSMGEPLPPSHPALVELRRVIQDSEEGVF